MSATFALFFARPLRFISLINVVFNDTMMDNVSGHFCVNKVPFKNRQLKSEVELHI